MIGGNTLALFQVRDGGKKNAIGEREHNWVDVASSKGWLDLSGGDSKYTTYNAKIQESTHIFLCDYQTLNFISGEISTLTSDKKVDVTSENARMLIDGLIYQIMLIDDPMNLHQHLEIYLKFVGGQDG